MIIVRSPLRISLGGGGTDLQSYYRDHSGFLIAGAINKYVYITLHKTFVEELIIKYSKMEQVREVDEIQHPIIREAIKATNAPIQSLEITSMADIHAGTGLGSSGSFTTALLKALHTYSNNIIHPHELAEQACDIEINRLKEPVGKQDQFIAAYGGLTCFRFMPNGMVEAEPLRITDETLFNLEDNLLMFSTGLTRRAGDILKTQDKMSKSGDADMINNLHFIKELGFKSRVALEEGNLREFAELLKIHWEHKKQRSNKMSNPQIDEWYNLAMNNGALGGKLIGAGGGGFLMFYVEDKIPLRRAMREAGLREVRFSFEFEGTKVIVNER